MVFFYQVLSNFLNFERGLNAEISKYGDCIWIFPRDEYNGPSVSEHWPSTLMLRIALENRDKSTL